MIIGMVGHPLKAGGQIKTVGKGSALGMLEQPLCQAHRPWRLGCDLSSQLYCPTEQFILLRDLKYDAETQRLLRRNEAPGKSELSGPLIADQALQKPGTAIARYDAEIYKCLAHDRRAGSKSKITHAGKIKSCTDRRSVNRRNERHLRRFHRMRNSLNSTTILILNLLNRPAENSTPFTHFPYVAAR